jgi:hypothetical protein
MYTMTSSPAVGYTVNVQAVQQGTANACGFYFFSKKRTKNDNSAAAGNAHKPE